MGGSPFKALDLEEIRLGLALDDSSITLEGVRMEPHIIQEAMPSMFIDFESPPPKAKKRRLFYSERKNQEVVDGENWDPLSSPGFLLSSGGLEKTDSLVFSLGGLSSCGVSELRRITVKATSPKKKLVLKRSQIVMV